MNDFPDIFGPYARGMNRSNKDIIKELRTDSKNMDIKSLLLQCTFEEYINMKHDEDYIWYQLNIDNNSNRKMSIGFNRRLYGEKQSEQDEFIKRLDAIWLKQKLRRIEKTKRIEGTYELKMKSIEMIQSAHFFMHNHDEKNQENDIQILKIIYPYSSLKKILERLK